MVFHPIRTGSAFHPILLFLLAALHQDSWSAGPAVLSMRILEDGPGRLSVEVQSGTFRVERVEEADASRILCRGCQGREAGAPDLPVHRIDVPAGLGEPEARVTVLEAEALPPMVLAPVPRSLDPVRREFRMDAALRAAAGRAGVRLLPASTVHGVPIRGLLVPLALLAPDGSVSLLRRIRVDVTWQIIPTERARPRPAPKATARRGAAELGDRFLRIRIGDRTVDQNGEDRVYALTFADLAKASPEIKGGVRIRDLRLFAGPADSLTRKMGALPADAESHPGRLREIPLEVIDDGDETLDDGDTLRFFCHGTGRWKRIPGAQGPVRYAFASDPYSFENHYFLSYAGGATGSPLRLIRETPPPRPEPPATSAQHYLRAEQERATGGCEAEGRWDEHAGFAWFWHRLAPCGASGDTVLGANQLARPSVATLTDFDPSGGGVRIGFHMTLSASSRDVFRVHVAGGRTPLEWVEDSTAPGAWYAWEGPQGGQEAFRIDSLAWAGGTAFLDGYTVAYPRKLAFRGAPLWIFPEHRGRWASWQVQDAAGLHCLRVVDGVADRLWKLDGQGRFSDSLPADADVGYLVYAGSTAVPEGALSQEVREPPATAVRNLWLGEKDGAGGLPEYLILTSRPLLDKAVALRDFRRDGRRAVPLRASVVLVEDIYREFAGGRASPVALRDFLRWALHRWDPRGSAANPLRHVLLYGKGHYDYRGLATSDSKEGIPMHVPPYEGYSDNEAVASDDFFARLDSGEVDFGDGGLDLAVGRLPFRTPDQAGAYLAKVKAYEEAAQGGVWRSRAVWAADDHLQRGQKDREGRVTNLDGIAKGHTNDAERLAETLQAADPAMLVDRVYLLDYPLNSSWRKPQASQDLVSFINRGALVVNYVGHGSADQWADEVLFQTGDALSLLDNRGRTGMINSFSCAVGRNDAPAAGLSEALVTAPKVGAIASVSATRESYADPNFALADAFYARVFPADSSASPRFIGTALRDAKNLKADRNPLNDAKYSLLGEPVILLRKPALRVSFTRAPDTVRARDCGIIQGTVDGGGGTGFINLKLVAGSIHKEYDLDSTMVDQKSDRRGAILFEQTVPYKDGRFSLDYLFPSRIPFGDTTSRLIAYAWDGGSESEGSAAITGLHIREPGRSSASSDGCGNASDGQGPRILITGCEPKEDGGIDFPGQVRLSLPSCLNITVEDSSGGVLGADGPDEGTTFEVPGILDPFHPQPGVDELYRKTFRLALDARDFRPGSHVFRVTAEDGYGNRSLRVLRMDLTSEPAILAFTAHNVPNPVKRGGTAFYFSALLPAPDFDVNQDGKALPERVEFEVRIFDQAGRLVKALRQASSGIRWDGRDEWGSRLANGVYFYTVISRWKGADYGPERNVRTVSTRRNTLVISR